MINLTDTAAKVTEQRRIHRAMLMLEVFAERRIRPILGKQFLAAAKLVAQGLRIVDSAVDAQQSRFVAVVAGHYRRVAVVFNRDAMRLMEGVKGISPPQAKDAQGEFWATLLPWIQKNAAEKCKHLSRVSKNHIKRIIASGMSEGLSNEEIATKLRKVSKVANPQRAHLIARNETHVAAVYAVDQSVRSVRVKMKREWMSALDERVRLAHKEANEQKRGQDEPFLVGGERLMYPGDPSGSPWNTIQCRCVLLYHTVRSAFKEERRCFAAK